MTEDKRKQLLSNLEEYFSRHTKEWNYCIEELDSWSGYLGDDRFYRMDEIDVLLGGRTASDILGIVNGNFNCADDYFYFDCLGYLCSTNNPDYSNYLDSCTIEEIVKVWSHLYITALDIDSKALNWFKRLVEDEEEEIEEENKN